LRHFLDILYYVFYKLLFKRLRVSEELLHRSICVVLINALVRRKHVLLKRRIRGQVELALLIIPIH
jgi:hypothetical protein